LRILHQSRQPARVKGRHIGIERRRADEKLRVAGPAGALVALRTIRRHFDKIIALAPRDVSDELVHERT
jgi:hypothetical protein